MLPEDLVTSVAETDAYIDHIVALEKERDLLRELARAAMRFNEIDLILIELFEKVNTIDPDWMKLHAPLIMEILLGVDAAFAKVGMREGQE